MLVRFPPAALLEFRGPDAVRFLNGQITQDVRFVAGGKNALPSCITDAKGKLQFRVRITESPNGALWVEGPEDSAEALEARLTRYLIADDVEVTDLSGRYVLNHFIGSVPHPPAGVFARESMRFGVAGSDWWSPAGYDYELPTGTLLHGDELEALRISHGTPLWERDLFEGMLPPEAGLDTTDISYQKGCYIGQEVISRIKSAGKLNRRLTRFEVDADAATEGALLIDGNDNEAGTLTSVSPIAQNKQRQMLGYLKRGVTEVWLQTTKGERYRLETPEK